MKIRSAWRRCAAVAVLLAASGVASADVFSWSFTPGQPGGNYDQNNSGGTFQSMNSTFNTASKQLDFTVRFSNQVTKGFWLVINNGPNPKDHPGELAIFYLDASRLYDADTLNNPVYLTAYGYNGVNGPNSWQDGNPVAPGNQAGDLIKGINEAGTWISSLSVADSAGGRQFSFSVDAKDIIGHTPLYPDAVDPWYGTGFDSKLGVWFHPVTSLTTSYGSGRGGLTSATFGTSGWLDGSNFNTSKNVPAPGAAALVGLGGLLAAKRRRRA